MRYATSLPLFEKLIDEDTDAVFEKNPRTNITLSELQTSIMNDLSDLLNTRVAVFWKDYNHKHKSIPFSYGINASDAIYSENVLEIQELEERIEKIILQYEPRLLAPKVMVQATEHNPCSLFINVSAAVKIDNRTTVLSFPIVMTN